MNGSRLGRTALAILTVTLSLIVASLALEIGLRLFWDGYYFELHRNIPRGHVDFHPTRGSANVAHAADLILSGLRAMGLVPSRAS